MDILSDKIVTTRKAHFCSACDRIFEAGTRMRAQVNTYDGIGTWRECPTCIELLSKYRDHFEGGYGICEAGCVDEVRNIGESPEQLLERLNSSENPDSLNPSNSTPLK